MIPSIPQWLLDWLAESWQRLKMKRPKFFRNLGRAGDIVIMLTGLPYLLVQAEDMFGFTAPAFLTVLSNKLAFGIGIGVKLASHLTVKSTHVAQTVEGQAVSVLDTSKLPFTEKSEAKEVRESVPPLPVDPTVPEPSELSIELPNRE